MEFEFFDGSRHKVIVHLLYLKEEGPTSQKSAGFVGAKDIFLCRFCDIEGLKYPHCNSYYITSKVHEPSSPNSRSCLVKKYDLARMKLRTFKVASKERSALLPIQIFPRDGKGI